MTELKDYSGEFNPDLKLGDFSRDALVRAWQATSKCMVLIDGKWLTKVRQVLGEQKALELEAEVWKEMVEPETRHIQEALNIYGDDVPTIFKLLQCLPDSVGTVEEEYEIKNKNHGILTFRRCRPLEYAERHGDVALQETMCGIDLRALQEVANYVNPKAKVTSLKLPPRKSKDEIPCQWEFKIEI